MKAITCEMCGSNDLVKKDGLFVCQNCGTKYTVEEAKKLIGTVKIDKTEETEKLLILARRAREDDNWENAEKYYGLVLQENPNNWEASFFQVYFSAMQGTIRDISKDCYSVANCIDSTMKLISELPDPTEKKDALAIVVEKSINYAIASSDSAIRHYNEFPSVDGARSECSGRIVAAYSIFEMLEETLKSYFPDEIERILFVQKEENSFISSQASLFNTDFLAKTTNRLTNEIRRAEPSYTQPKVQMGGCYVATAVYGSYDCSEVWTLRRYRDDILAKTWYGRAFIHVYYTVSPSLVKLFGNTKAFTNFWKPKLDKKVSRLNSKGVANTPYNDRPW